MIANSTIDVAQEFAQRRDRFGGLLSRHEVTAILTRQPVTPIRSEHFRPLALVAYLLLQHTVQRSDYHRRPQPQLLAT